MQEVETMADAYEIERGVPFPRESRVGAPVKYPWAEMKVGDSFFVKGAEAGILHGTARSWRKRNAPDWVFSCRTENDGARIWRIK